MKKPLAACLLLLAACDPIPDMPSMGDTSKDAGIQRLANATRAAGDVDSTLSLTQESAQLYPKDAGKHAELAQLQLASGKAEDATLTLRQALKYHPDDRNLQLLLGQAYIHSQKPAKALPVLEKYRKPGSPDEYKFLTYQGIALDMLEQNAAAQAAYKEGLAIAPPEATTPIRNDLAMSYLVEGKVNEASKIWQKLMDEGEDNPTIRQNLALAYAISGNEDRAMELGLRDLERKQAQENIDFAREYREKAGK